MILSAKIFEARARRLQDEIVKNRQQADDALKYLAVGAGGHKAPTDITLSASIIAENNSINDVVGALSSTSSNAGDTFTYSLVSGTGSTDNASFNISGSNLRATDVFNFESKSSYDIRIQTTNQVGMTFEKQFTISITNVNETPTDITLSASSIAENNSVNDVVGSFSTTDPDSGNTFTYSLVSGTGSTDNASFNISGANLRATDVFNFEAKSSYAIRVRSTDQGSLTVEKQFTITITNVNEAPTNITLSNASVAEDLAVGMAVGTLSTTDPDSGNTFTYTITTDADNKFDIRNNELFIDHALDYETKTSHDVTVRSTDQGGLYYEKTFTITVTNIADETTPPSLDPANFTPTSSGTYDVTPVATKSNGKTKTQGKATSVASMILSIGAPSGGASYIAHYDPDFSLLSNTGKDAFVGWGMKSGNNFHFVGLKGDGSTGLKKAKISGSWNALGSATVDISGGAPANGTQAGPNWIRLDIATNGSTYTFYTGSGADVDTAVWTSEFSGVSPSPLTNVTDASDFGVAAFFPATDIGQFTIEIDTWSQVFGLYVTTVSSASNLSAYTFTATSLGVADTNRNIILAIGWTAGSALTISSVTIGGVAMDLMAQRNSSVGGAALMQLVVASGTTGDIVVTMSGTATSLAATVYRSTTPNVLPYCVAARNYTTTANVLPDIPVKNNGFIIMNERQATGDDAAVTWSGTDSPTVNNRTDVESIQNLFASWLTTEDNKTRDLTLTSSGSVQKGALAASFAPPSELTFYLGSRQEEVDASAFTIKKFALGPADANRTIILAISYTAASQRSLTSVTIGGSTATVISERHGSVGGQFVVALAVASGTSADVVITLSGTATSMNCAGYRTTLTNLIVTGNGVGAVGTTTFNINNIRIRNGGFVVLASNNSSVSDDNVITWSGGDSPVVDRNTYIDEAVQMKAVSIQATESISTRSLTFTTSGSVSKGAAAAAFAAGYSQPVSLFTQSEAQIASQTTYTFSHKPIENPASGRMIVVCGAITFSTARTISSVTIGGASATVIQNNGTTGGSFLAYVALASGVVADVVVTASGACTSCAIGVYSTNPSSTTPVDSGSTTGTTATVTVADIEVKNGGFLIVAARSADTATLTASYNGTDTLTKDTTESIGSASGERFSSLSALTTQGVTTNDPGVTGTNTVGKQVCAASWL